MQRRIKSYVLRAGRLSPRQAHGLEKQLVNYVLSLDEQPWDVLQVFGREAETILEIGFGMGASLIIMAEQEPDTNFIGIEVHEAGVGALAADISEKQISNIKIAPYDAVMVLEKSIAPESINGVQIFFPDPWPKKRHHKRRLIQPAFIQMLLRALKPGGFIHCATDWQDYADHMLTVLSAEPLLKNQYEDFAPRPARRPLTKFEMRGQALGHGVWDLIFLKQG